MQKAIRFNESQLLYLANKARQENTISAHLYKKSSDTGKWQLRWFSLYQNLLFYFENDTSTRPSGVALLEGSYCDRVLTTAGKAGKDNQVATLDSSLGSIYIFLWSRQLPHPPPHIFWSIWAIEIIYLTVVVPLLNLQVLFRDITAWCRQYSSFLIQEIPMWPWFINDIS